MRYFLLILTVLFSWVAKAQDSLVHHKADSLFKSGNKVLGKQDTAARHLDSLKGKINKLGGKLPLSSQKASIPDSLNPAKKIAETSGAVNSKMKSMTRVDSLFLFNQDLRKADSLKLAFQKKSEQIRNKAGVKQKKVKKSLDSLQRAYDAQAGKLAKKFREANKDVLAGHEKELAGKLNLNTPAVSGIFPNNPNSSIPGNSLNLNGAPSLPAVPAINGVGNVSLPNTNAGLPGSPLNGPTPNVNLAKDLPQAGDLNKLGKEGEAYSKQLQQLKKDSLASANQAQKWTEDQIQGRSEIKAIKDKQRELEKQQKLQQEYLKKVAEYQSPKKAEDEIKKELTKVANADLLKNQKELQSAQKEMSKAKKKYSEFQSIKNLPKRPLNPMRELSFRERFYPGMLMQVVGGKYYSIDFAPQAYYKITTRFDAGAGFIYRLNVDFNKSSLVQNHQMYGFKLFSNFKIYKSFYFRLEGERVNRQIPITATSDAASFHWTNTLLGGIGKEFTISKKLHGNSQVLYNALDTEDSPYGSKFLFRFGFNLSLKKDQRKEFIRSLE